MNAKEKWLEVKEELKRNLDIDVYEGYFEDINDVHKTTGNSIYLIVDSLFTKTRINNNYLVRMNTIYKRLFNDDVQFRLITKEEIAKEKKEESENKNTNKENNFGLNPNYTFSNFIVGDSNRLAHRYAAMVADQLAEIANPVYIFGDVGLGKTHLMQAIGNEICESKPDKNILYIRTEDFVEGYVKATRYKDYDAFGNKFNNIDVLLIDDIQFLEGKKESQLEFFKIFERLTNEKKLIVLTSDRKASDLTQIMTRLTSRFEWGISLDINKPDKQHRINILTAKIKQELKDPSAIGEDVIDYVATVCDNNIRELEGALRRLLFYCAEFELDYTVESAQEALKNIISSPDVEVAPSKDIKKMFDIVSTYFKMDQNDLFSDSRKKNIVYARKLCWYILRSKYDLTFQKIGDIFGGKHYSTIMSGFESFENDYSSSEETRKNVENILRKMGKNPNEI